MKKILLLICVGSLAGVTAGCAVAPLDDGCVRTPARIIASPGRLQIIPECLEVDAGQTIILELVGGKLPGTAHSRPDKEKNPKAKWLKQSNQSEREIRIDVPKDKPGERGEGAKSCIDDVCTFKYEIVIEGVGMLDPRIRVNF